MYLLQTTWRAQARFSDWRSLHNTLGRSDYHDYFGQEVEICVSLLVADEREGEVFRREERMKGGLDLNEEIDG